MSAVHECFVISPIGNPGSPTREHADDVYECIIDPALKKTEVQGHRADHIKDVGRITKQMYDDILSSDFCIALLHGFNPNVFYELAIAHSAGIPVILLSEKGLDPPFDLKDERVFHYDLGPRIIHRGDNVVALVGMIDSVRRLGGKREVPFGSNLTPLNASAAVSPYKLTDNSHLAPVDLLQLVTAAKIRLYLGGIGFTGWSGIQGMKARLGAIAASGCEIRIMTMHAQNPAFASMINPEVTPAKVTGQKLENTRDWFRKALGDAPNSVVRAIRNGMIFNQIIICDDRASISPYLYSTRTGGSPCIDINGSCKAFDAFMSEFDYLWKLNTSQPSSD